MEGRKEKGSTNGQQRVNDRTLALSSYLITYTYDNITTISFKPDTILKSNTNYTAFIKTKVRGLGNDKLPTDYTFNFTTEVLNGPSSLVYNNDYYQFTTGVSTSPISPSYTGYITSCSASPSLPSGLYVLNDGTRSDVLPIGADDFDHCEPIYEEMPGWKESTAGIKEFDGLPKAAQNYLKYLEAVCEVPIDMISTGPDREDTILLRHPFE